MIFYEFKRQLEALVVFSLHDIYMIEPGFRQATLYDWEAAGRVKKLRNNYYVFSDFNPENLDFYLISNALYDPSYVSLEMALNHYGVIPEFVGTVTAVTTNKTYSLTTDFASFSYQTIRPDLFFGYDLLEVRNHGVRIAQLEKAVLDYIYFNTDINSPDVFEALRWNRQVISSELRYDVFQKYLSIFSSKAVTERTSYFFQFLEKETNA